MKKVIVTIACIIATGITGSVLAQQHSGSLIVDNMQSLHITSGYRNNIHVKAMRDFLKRYKTAIDVEWLTLPIGYEVRYSGPDDSRCRTVYNRKGQFVYTIKQYYEPQLSEEIRRIVKSNYYDYTITLIEETEQPNQPVIYIVHLQNDTSLKNVTVCEGAMEVLEDYKRIN